MPTKPTPYDLLLRLADLLERDAKKKRGIKFDWGQWGYNMKMGNQHQQWENYLCGYYTTKKPTVRPKARDTRPSDMSCGTTACAMGLAALSNKFPDLKARWEENGVLAFRYKGRKTDPFWAAQEIFKLSDVEATYLFTPDGNYSREGTRAELFVAKRIRNFVKAKMTGKDPFPKKWKDDHPSFIVGGWL